MYIVSINYFDLFSRNCGLQSKFKFFVNLLTTKAPKRIQRMRTSGNKQRLTCECMACISLNKCDRY